MFKNHSRCGEFGIGHLCFADHLLLFTKGDLESITMLFSFFNSFPGALGLQAKLNKNCVYVECVNHRAKTNIFDHIGFIVVEIPFKSLGILITTQKLSLMQWQPLIKRITTKMSYWIARKLTYTRRVQLTQLILFGMQAF